MCSAAVDLTTPHQNRQFAFRGGYALTPPWPAIDKTRWQPKCCTRFASRCWASRPGCKMAKEDPAHAVPIDLLLSQVDRIEQILV